ncbi:MAG TPA: hypothetical protein VKU41_04315 [Polyangiaceae bacterium]|nr:hypothetical protein [Polyangiaceae bacterium]
MRRVRPPFGALLVVAAAGVASGAAAAPGPAATNPGPRSDEKQACASVAEEAEQLRIDAHFLAARERLLRCSRAECPAAVRGDCAQWMNEVAAAIPTVVLAARDPRGQDVLAAHAWVDGAPVVQGLDGKALEIDPGVHKFRFEAAGASVEQLVVIREGEKNRAITATLGTARAAPPPDAPSGGVPARPSPRPSPWTWALGGGGLVALGLGAYLELSVNADAASLAESCGHNCAHSQVDPLVLEQQVLGPIAFAVGAVALGVAAYTLFAVPTTGGAVVGAQGHF